MAPQFATPIAILPEPQPAGNHIEGMKMPDFMAGFVQIDPVCDNSQVSAFEAAFLPALDNRAAASGNRFVACQDEPAG